MRCYYRLSASISHRPWRVIFALVHHRKLTCTCMLQDNARSVPGDVDAAVRHCPWQRLLGALAL